VEFKALLAFCDQKDFQDQIAKHKISQLQWFLYNIKPSKQTKRKYMNTNKLSKNYCYNNQVFKPSQLKMKNNKLKQIYTIHNHHHTNRAPYKKQRQKRAKTPYTTTTTTYSTNTPKMIFRRRNEDRSLM
jgi:hypothetical protein